MHIRHLLTALEDILFPPRLEERLVRTYTHADVQKLYSPSTQRNITALTHYSKPEVRALIHEAKFHKNGHAIALLGEMLRLYRDTSGLHDALWVPIPLSPARFRARGYNQVVAVLESANITITDILTRTRDTRPQTTRTRSERLTNVQNAFACSDCNLVYGAHIILLDDVTTTGATLRDAQRALHMCGPVSITCVALAH